MEVRPEPGRERSSSPESIKFPVSVKINKEKLSGLEIPPDLKAWISRLPDTLTIGDRRVLVVGPNGSGKSQFAHALVAALSRGEKGGSFVVKPDEPASMLRDIFEFENATNEPLSGAVLHGGDIVAGMKQWADRDTGRHRSSRQLFDEGFKIMLGDRVRKGQESKTALIIDEPEVAVDPERNAKIEQELMEACGSLGLVIIPTNSPSLLASEIPRLYTTRPEDGISSLTEKEREIAARYREAHAELMTLFQKQ